MTRKAKIIRRIVIILVAIVILTATSIYGYKSYKASITPVTTVYNAFKKTIISSSSITVDIYKGDSKKNVTSLDGWYRVQPIEQQMTLYIKSDEATDVIDVDGDDVCFYNRVDREKKLSLESLSDVTGMDYHLFYSLLSAHSNNDFKDIDYNTILRDHEIGQNINEYIHLFNLGNTLDNLRLALDENSKTVLNYKEKDDVIYFSVKPYDFFDFCLKTSADEFVSSTAYDELTTKLNENKEALDALGDVEISVTLIDGYYRNVIIKIDDTNYNIFFRGIARDNNELSNSIKDSINEYKANN